MNKLNLGCGKDYRQGWVNVDFRDDVKLDAKHNLNKIPYPFKKNQFDIVLMRMILEHLDNPIKVLKEIIRISKNKAIIEVVVPHANSYAAITDIQHKTHFTENSFNKNLLEEYGLNNLILKKVELQFKNTWKKCIPFKKYLKIFFIGVYDNIKFIFEVKK